jgi:hypothetical protein
MTTDADSAGTPSEWFEAIVAAKHEADYRPFLAAAVDAIAQTCTDSLPPG